MRETITKLVAASCLLLGVSSCSGAPDATPTLVDVPGSATIAPTVAPAATEAGQEPSEPLQVCEPDKWELLVIAVKETPSASGMKFVTVDLAVRNGSRYWAYLDTKLGVTTRTVPYATAEGVFTYYSRDQWGRHIPIGSSVRIPPQASVSTAPMSGDEAESYRFRLEFEVAENQKNLSIHLPNMTIYCMKPGQMASDKSAVFTLKGDTKDLRNPPLFADSDFLPLNQPVEVTGYGKVELLETTRSAGKLSIRFRFTNASEGYKANGHLFGHLIYDDGSIQVPSPATYFTAGPASSVESTMTFNDMGRNGPIALALWYLTDLERSPGVEYPIYQVFSVK